MGNTSKLSTNIVYNCPLCGSGCTEVVWEREQVPVHQNVICSTKQEAKDFARGDLRLMFCRKCGFVFNAAFDVKGLHYSSAYDNTQICSPYFQRFVHAVSEHLLRKYCLVGKLIVEVGCGKGHFLRLLCAGGRNRGLGFDPAYAGPETAENGSVRFVRKFYGQDYSPTAADFVCSRHVLEHVAYPMEMLRAIRRALEDRKDSVVYFEVPDLAWILDQVAFWDFFYEHCSYFTARSLTRALEESGFEVLQTSSLFEGQYLGIEARPTHIGRRSKVAPDGEITELQREIAEFRSAYERKSQGCREKVLSLHKAGGCALWGAAAKGVTFANILDPEHRYIRYLIDINPAKQGKFVPGSAHQIVAPEDTNAGHSRIAGIISMNPNYLQEQRDRLAQTSSLVPIIAL